MTIPTESVSARHRERVEREAHEPDQAERRDDRRRDRDRRDQGRAEVGQEQENDKRRENRADDEVFLDVVDRGLDELGSIADNPQVVADRQRLLDLLDAFLGIVRNLHRVGTRLPRT